ncbi:putative histone deacetylase SIR2 [Toxoplasma gondii VEG]|uniref:protein acetyllysine N-acetyltransferase n=1 Tax=Toxoplasma gondii (strain ATCC 50861 / VEG) TaxID=432359 RepID=B9QP13_TOXGV|nr:putative histone deacetylase SIR2 [Toxoplasma gondii VEG]CEL75690.1 TPA: Sir2 domain-containing protein [Toxoplasma gondii VEG]
MEKRHSEISPRTASSLSSSSRSTSLPVPSLSSLSLSSSFPSTSPTLTALGYASRLSEHPDRGPVGRPELEESDEATLEKKLSRVVDLFREEAARRSSSFTELPQANHACATETPRSLADAAPSLPSPCSCPQALSTSLAAEEDSRRGARDGGEEGRGETRVRQAEKQEREASLQTFRTRRKLTDTPGGVCVHTGAGISTSAGILDFRGPSGVWTLEAKGQTLSDDGKDAVQVSFGRHRRPVCEFHLALPTLTHLLLRTFAALPASSWVTPHSRDVRSSSSPSSSSPSSPSSPSSSPSSSSAAASSLSSSPSSPSSSSSSSSSVPVCPSSPSSPFAFRMPSSSLSRFSPGTVSSPGVCGGDASLSPPLVRYIITQNVDGLHARCGTPFSRLGEVHGSMFTERCDACARRFLRDFPLPTLSFQPTGRLCGLCSFPPSGVCTDVLLDWHDRYERVFETLCLRHTRAASLHLCLGSSLQIEPACHFPGRERRRGSALVVANLQETPLDRKAEVCLRYTTDGVAARLGRAFGALAPEDLRGSRGTKERVSAGGRAKGMEGGNDGAEERVAEEEGATTMETEKAVESRDREGEEGSGRRLRLLWGWGAEGGRWGRFLYEDEEEEEVKFKKIKRLRDDRTDASASAKSGELPETPEEESSIPSAPFIRTSFLFVARLPLDALPAVVPPCVPPAAGSGPKKAGKRRKKATQADVSQENEAVKRPAVNGCGEVTKEARESGAANPAKAEPREGRERGSEETGDSKLCEEVDTTESKEGSPKERGPDDRVDAWIEEFYATEHVTHPRCQQQASNGRPPSSCLWGPAPRPRRGQRCLLRLACGLKIEEIPLHSRGQSAGEESRPGGEECTQREGGAGRRELKGGRCASGCGDAFSARISHVDALRGLWVLDIFRDTRLRLFLWYGTTVELVLFHAPLQRSLEVDVWQFQLACTRGTAPASLPPSLAFALQRERAEPPPRTTRLLAAENACEQTLKTRHTHCKTRENEKDREKEEIEGESERGESASTSGSPASSLFSPSASDYDRAIDVSGGERRGVVSWLSSSSLCMRPPFAPVESRATKKRASPWRRTRLVACLGMLRLDEQQEESTELSNILEEPAKTKTESRKAENGEAVRLNKSELSDSLNVSSSSRGLAVPSSSACAAAAREIPLPDAFASLFRLHALATLPQSRQKLVDTLQKLKRKKQSNFSSSSSSSSLSSSSSSSSLSSSSSSSSLASSSSSLSSSSLSSTSSYRLRRRPALKAPPPLPKRPRPQNKKEVFSSSQLPLLLSVELEHLTGENLTEGKVEKGEEKKEGEKKEGEKRVERLLPLVPRAVEGERRHPSCSESRSPSVSWSFFEEEEAVNGDFDIGENKRVSVLEKSEDADEGEPRANEAQVGFSTLRLEERMGTEKDANVDERDLLPRPVFITCEDFELGELFDLSVQTEAKQALSATHQWRTVYALPISDVSSSLSSSSSSPSSSFSLSSPCSASTFVSSSGSVPSDFSAASSSDSTPRCPSRCSASCVERTDSPQDSRGKAREKREKREEREEREKREKREREASREGAKKAQEGKKSAVAASATTEATNLRSFQALWDSVYRDLLAVQREASKGIRAWSSPSSSSSLSPPSSAASPRRSAETELKKPMGGSRDRREFSRPETAEATDSAEVQKSDEDACRRKLAEAVLVPPVVWQALRLFPIWALFHCVDAFECM